MPGKRITFRQRVKLQVLLEDPRTKSLSEILRLIGLNRTTIYLEIIHRRISKGSRRCPDRSIVPQRCDLLKTFPFCCNTCFKRQYCTKERFVYDAYLANDIFERTKRTCTKKPNISDEELKTLDNKVSPRIMIGQSIYHIVSSDKTIKQSEQTIRRYIRNGYLHAKIIDLPRTVQRRTHDYVINRQSRVDVKTLTGRMYDDYITYKNQRPEAVFLQMDTVIGTRNDSKVILTLFEPNTKLQFGILVNNSSLSINEALVHLIEELEVARCKFFSAILTDNGFEFKDLPKIEISSEGEIRFRLFYCDPYASYQKGGCERNHEFFRYVKRKGISFNSMTQSELDSIFSNINSYKRKSLNGLSPYQAFKSKYGLNTLEVLHISYVEPTKVILKR